MSPLNGADGFSAYHAAASGVIFSGQKFAGRKVKIVNTKKQMITKDKLLELRDEFDLKVKNQKSNLAIATWKNSSGNLCLNSR